MKNQHQAEQPDDASAVPSQEYSVDVQGAVRALVSRMLSAGMTEQELFARLGMDDIPAEQSLASLSVPGTRWPLSRCVQLWQMAEKTLQQASIALHLPIQDRAHPRHVLFYVAPSCATLHEAVTLWCRFGSLFGDADRLRLEVDGKVARLSYAPLEWRWNMYWSIEYMLSVLWANLTRLSESRIAVRGVSLSAPAPSYAHQFETVFRAPVTFAADDNALVFDAALLQRPLPHADAYWNRILLRQIQLMHEDVEQALSIELRVRRALIDLLLDGEDASAQGVALALGYTVRRLRQLLESSGSNFRTISEQVKKDGAAHLLRRGLDIGGVASRLGFSESSALHHAFKRWYGMSMGEFLTPPI